MRYEQLQKMADSLVKGNNISIKDMPEKDLKVLLMILLEYKVNINAVIRQLDSVTRK